MASEHDTVLCYGLICVDAMIHCATIRRRMAPPPWWASGSASAATRPMPVRFSPTWAIACASPATVSGGIVRGAGCARLARIANLDASLLHLDPQATTPRNIILSARDGTRTILVDSATSVGVPLSDGDLEGVGMVVLDSFLNEAAVAIAALAHRRGIPVCTLDVRADSPLAPLCTLVINSTDFIDAVGIAYRQPRSACSVREYGR